MAGIDRPGGKAGDRDKALETALAQIERQFGRGSIMRLGDEARAPIEVIPTGAITLDIALGIGGLPRGRVVEIFGPEGSGKALALDTPMPVDLDISLRGRLSPPLEAACYFAVAEALANAVKHSGARRVHIRVAHADGVLRIEVSDDGAGGADLQQGSGLRGVERRLSTFDGIMAVSSPPGGPTMIVMEVPCALSSPRTSSS